MDTEVDGAGEEVGGPGDAWGTEERPECSGGGGAPNPPALPLLPLPPVKCSKRPTLGCNCSCASAASDVWKERRN